MKEFKRQKEKKREEKRRKRDVSASHTHVMSMLDSAQQQHNNKHKLRREEIGSIQCLQETGCKGT